jgi:hypothetical protein
MVEGKHIVYGILAYNWVFLGVLSLNLPALAEPARTYLNYACIGWLVHMWFAPEDLNLELFAKGHSPRILTNVGCFSWDGVTRKVDIDGYSYSVFYGNGCNYSGIFYPGDVALVAPSSHVLEIGRNRLVKTELNYGSLPSEVCLGPVQAVLTGHLIMDQFKRGNQSDDVDLARQYQSVLAVSEARGRALDQIMRVFSDVSMLGKMLNPQDPLKDHLLEAIDAEVTE